MLHTLALLLLTAALSHPILAEFTFSAYAPGDHILDHLKVEAASFAFNLGLAFPATYCPEPPSICPPGNETVFYSPSGISVEVPGGQQIYIAPSGLWTYTQAHSSSVPPGAYYGNWAFTAGAQHAGPCCPKRDPRYNCSPGLGYYTYASPDETTGGLFACPPPAYATVGTYTIYGRTPGFNLTTCVAIAGIRAHNYTGGGIGAWQYT